MMLSIKRIGLLILAAGALVALVVQAQTGISNQGIKFPDGSVQTTADPCAPRDPSIPSDPDDEMIQVGGVCIDKYEASVWDSPTGDGIQYGLDVDGNGEIDPGTEYPCSETGQDCAEIGKKIYARSVPDVQPSAFITWFQAEAALSNSGKRLPQNNEWQKAVQGTPDNTDCNVSSAFVSNTGFEVDCVSDWGAFDMVGNVWEWVADWGDNAVDCDNWDSTYGDDLSCVGLGEGEPNSSHLPGALVRGGGFDDGTDAGPFAVDGDFRPSRSFSNIGFRGAR